MIFITVGTHEQQFDRLLVEIDNLKNGCLEREEFVIQSGYSKVIPKGCYVKQFFDNEEMQNFYKNSNVVITHGGPCSIMQAMYFGKLPVVVPRNPHYEEHVDGHQIKFAEFLEAKKKILAVYDVKNLCNAIEKAAICSGMSEDSYKNNNYKIKIENFCRELETVIERIANN